MSRSHLSVSSFFSAENNFVSIQLFSLVYFCLFFFSLFRFLPDWSRRRTWSRLPASSPHRRLSGFENRKGKRTSTFFLRRTTPERKGKSLSRKRNRQTVIRAAICRWASEVVFPRSRQKHLYGGSFSFVWESLKAEMLLLKASPTNVYSKIKLLYINIKISIKKTQYLPIRNLFCISWRS